MIIGITGKKGSGKDTVGVHFMRHGYMRVAFAGVLKEAAKQIFDLSHGQVYGDFKVKETVDDRWGLTPREILQKLGTEVGRQGKFDTFEPAISARELEDWFNKLGLKVGETIWVDRAMKTIRESGHPKWVVTDVRFVNEAEAIKDADGYILRVSREEAQGSSEFEGHASETELDQIPADIQLLNNGTLADLWPTVSKIAIEVSSRMAHHSVLPAVFYAAGTE